MNTPQEASSERTKNDAQVGPRSWFANAMPCAAWGAAVLLVVVLGIGVARAGGAARSDIRYGVKISYHENEALPFPDFSLIYKGQIKSNPPQGLHPWPIYEFVVTSPGHEQKVTWSAGTGDIGPTQFHVGAKTFLLELRRSDTLGKLKDGELVIREAEAQR